MQQRMIETTVDGRYQILSRIAAGGMGEVYRAHDPVLEREVALKILHPSLAADAGFIDRFRREARSAAMLGHPNIVAVHDWGETGGTYFMVMEFIRGPNLRSVLMGNGAIHPAQASEIISGVLAALDHAHRQGIVHRDIKPENVMLTSAEGVPKVADFGLARAFADSRVSQAPGTVTGTVQYLAPEQVEGDQADPRTDLYSTGIVLYELLSGDVPFTGETSVAIAYKHLRERVPPPSTSNPMVPVALDRVVLNATQRDRHRRTAEARTMRAELAAAAAELPPAPPLSELASSVAPADEVPADRLSTVTIPRTLSPKQRRRQRLRRSWTWLSALVVLAAGGWAVWTYLVPHPTTVPSLVGRPVEEAQRLAVGAEMDFDIDRRAFSSDVPAGSIISQRPVPRSEAEEGDTLTVVVSRGPELAPVPDVSDQAVDVARQRLRKDGFETLVRQEYHERIPEGRVIDQTPPAGTDLEVGEPVRITVSLGKEPVDVPSVEGKSESEAGAILLGAELQVSVTEEFSATVPLGVVIRQEPAEGTTVDQDSTVTIVVSKGPRQFPMPNVVGQSTGAARAQLEDAGLVARVVEVPNSDGDQIVSQKPDQGTIVQQGQQVTIYAA
jgi:eukaryotic-like serine/threonine-protein kinase